MFCRNRSYVRISQFIYIKAPAVFGLSHLVVTGLLITKIRVN